MKRVLGNLTVGVFVISQVLTLHAESSRKNSESVLNCRDFESIYHFIHEQHLRIQSGEKEGFVKAAYEGMPEALRAMGHPLLGAHIEKAAKKFKPQVSTRKLCQQFRNSTYRQAFLKAFAKSLDPYSDFYPTAEMEAKAQALDGDFIGVGIGTEPDGDAIVITEVVEDGPAYGKLFVKDRIQVIDQKSVQGLSEAEIRSRIRGEKNTKVTFTGKRNGLDFKVTVKRDKVHQKSVSYAWLDQGMLNIKIHRFFRQTAGEVETIVREQGSLAKGYILDLRNNPGGLLQGARDIVDLFIDQGVVVYLKGKGLEDQVWALREGGDFTKPIVVLVNEGTASAAEIVAGALQDYGRALIVGQKTYGKGSVQNIYETQAALGTQFKGGLKLTTLWYYLPSGKNVGLMSPDVKLGMAKAETPHPLMPYHGPEQIDVVPLPSRKFKEKWSAPSLVDQSQDLEEVGKRLLKEMLAGR